MNQKFQIYIAKPNSWRLFRLAAACLTLVNGACLLKYLPGISSKQAEALALLSVRSALPLFVLAFTASSLVILWPSPFTRWLLRNRRYFGLAFAFGMAWHFSFVAYLLFSFEIHFSAFVLTLDAIGAFFLLLLTITSFRFVYALIGQAHWKQLHKVGVYAIWLLSIYIYQSGARVNKDLVHEIYLGVLLAAWLVRLGASYKLRSAHRNAATDCD